AVATAPLPKVRDKPRPRKVGRSENIQRLLERSNIGGSSSRNERKAASPEAKAIVMVRATAEPHNQNGNCSGAATRAGARTSAMTTGTATAIPRVPTQKD